MAALVPRYRVVAVISGRRSEEVADILGVAGVRYEGLYGMQEAAPELLFALLPQVESVAAVVPEARIEDKGASIAVHYRQTSDPVRARAALVTALQPVATASGLSLVEGKMVLELVCGRRDQRGPRRAAVLRRVVRGARHPRAFAQRRTAPVVPESRAAHRPDLDADDDRSLQRAGRGLATLKVAVAGPETPAELLKAAHRSVRDPAGLVELLRALV